MIRATYVVLIAALCGAAVAQLCGGGHFMNEGNECEACPKGSYAPEGNVVNECYKCGVGEYAEREGQWWCDECPEGYTTGDNGASGPTECVNKADIASTSWAYTLLISPTISGSVCGVAPALFEIEAVAPFSMRSHDCLEVDGTSRMTFELTISMEYSMELYKYVKWIQGHKNMLNAYAGYAKYGLEWFNESEEMKWTGIRFNTTMLDIENPLVDIQIKSIAHCIAGYGQQWDTSGENSYCMKQEANATADETTSRYFTMMLNKNYCGSNMGKAVTRLMVGQAKEFMAIDDGVSFLSFISCEATSDSESEMMVYIEGSNIAVNAFSNVSINQNMMRNTLGKFLGKDNVEQDFTVSQPTYYRGCKSTEGMQKTSDGRWECLVCRAGSYKDVGTGFCKPCPFGTYQDTAGSNECKACGLGEMTLTQRSTNAKYCLNLRDENWMDPKKANRWQRQLEGGFNISMDMGIDLELCPLAMFKHDIDAYCSDTYNMTAEPSSIEHLVCFGSMFITDENIIKALCGGGDSAQLSPVVTSAVNGALDGVNSLLSKIPGLSEKALPTVGGSEEDMMMSLIKSLCTFMQTLKMTQDAVRAFDSDTKDQVCENLGVNSVAKLEPFIKSQMYFSDGGIDMVTELMQGMNALPMFDSGNLYLAARAVLQRIGIGMDLSAFLSMEIASPLLMGGMSMIQGGNMRFAKMNTGVQLTPANTEDWFCANDEPKRDCGQYGYCENMGCDFGGQSSQMFNCVVDPCDNCRSRYQNKTTGEPVKCTGCNLPEKIANGWMKRKYHESNAQYECAAGFEFENRNSNGYCMWRNGEYNSTLPVCKVAERCNFDDEIENGRKQSSSNYSAVYRCNEGYAGVNGRVEAECSQGEVEYPECVSVYNYNCKFPEIDNGEIVDNGKENGTDWAYYKCNDGFEMEGGAVAYCNGSTAMNVPSCNESRPTCKFPEIDNGEIVDNGNKDGTYWAYYKCDDGFEMEGGAVAYCNGSTAMNVPSCNESRPTCKFPEIDNGEIVNNGNKDGTYWAYYKCDDGFEMEGGAVAYCNGSTAMNVPSCAKKENGTCSWPDIRNGMKKEGGIRNDTAWIRYECKDGFELAGNHSGYAYCSNGTAMNVPSCDKSGPSPTCKLPEIDNGEIVKDGYNNGTYWAYYECDDGFEMEGGAVAYCNGSTAMNVPSCNESRPTCKFPEIDNGEIVDNGNKDGTYWAYYKCDDGFEMEGGAVAYCNGSTAMNVPSCNESRPTCKFPEIDNGEIVDNGNKDGTYWAYYKCDDGFEMEGGAVAYCNGSTAMNVPSCAKNENGTCSWPDIRNGMKKEKGIKNGTAWMRYECKDGFKLAGNHSGYAYCSNGTAMNVPSCQEAYNPTCEFPDIDNGQIVSNGYKNGTYWAYYVCDDGFAMDGEAVAICQDATAVNVPSCKKLSCEWEKIKNGSIVENGTGWARYECDEGYSFVNEEKFGSEYAMCEGGVIYQTPICEKDEEDKMCRFPVVKNGELVQRGRKNEVVWALYKCNDGYQMKDGSIAYCRDGVIKKDGFPQCFKKEEDDSDDEKECHPPKEIKNGGMVSGSYNETDNTAQYYCNQGSIMYKTSRGNVGFCNFWNMTITPICVPKEEYYKLAFKLVGGKSANKGVVVITSEGESGTVNGPNTICDDGMSFDTANVACREMGFSGGRKVSLTGIKQSKFPFAVTNIKCKDIGESVYQSCKWGDYGEAGTRPCTSNEQVAIECYNGKPFEIKMAVTGKVNKKITKLACNGKVVKEGVEKKLKDYKPEIWFGGVLADGTTVDMMKTISKITTGRKGYTAKSTSTVKYACYKCCMSIGEEFKQCADNCPA